MFWVRLSGIAAVLTWLGLAWYLAPLGTGALALQFTFTPRAFAEIVHAWPAELLLRYRTHLAFDLLLLACYGAFGYLLETRTAWFAALSLRGRAFARHALPVAALFDTGENALHAWLTALPRFGVDPLYALAGTCSLLKWALLLAFVALAAVAWVKTVER